MHCPNSPVRLRLEPCQLVSNLRRRRPPRTMGTSHMATMAPPLRDPRSLTRSRTRNPRAPPRKATTIGARNRKRGSEETTPAWTFQLKQFWSCWFDGRFVCFALFCIFLWSFAVFVCLRFALICGRFVGYADLRVFAQKTRSTKTTRICWSLEDPGGEKGISSEGDPFCGEQSRHMWQKCCFTQY